MSYRITYFVLTTLIFGLMTLAALSLAVKLLVLPRIELSDGQGNIVGGLLISISLLVGLRRALWVDKAWRLPSD